MKFLFVAVFALCAVGLQTTVGFKHNKLYVSPKSRLSMDLNISPQRNRVPWWKSAIVSLGIISTTVSYPAGYSALAADTVKIGKCLLTTCQKELAQCILDPKCLANVICLNTCNNRPDEAACQIRCGDNFEDDVVGKFNKCAVSEKKCVPQKPNENEYPLPSTDSMVKSFDSSFWNGRFYITAGLNKIFDTFDCQVHFFTSPSPGKFYAKLFWRINEPDGEFFTKNAVQKFVQDPKNPAHFINHDNDYLNYKDDWYIIDSVPDEYALIYYRGSNDAWDGYGGAFLYSRSPTVKPEWIPQLEKAVDSMKLKYKWSDFTLTDNSCKKQAESNLVLREKFAKKLVMTEEEQLQQQLTTLRSAAKNTLLKEEKEAQKSILFLEKELEAFEAEIAKDANAIVKEAEKVEKVVEQDILEIERDLKIRK